MAVESTPWILTAAGIVVANDAIFAPVIAGQKPFSHVNWRVVPATALAALTLAGLEKLSPALGKGLGILAVLTVLIVPLGNAPSPIDNAYTFMTKIKL